MAITALRYIPGPALDVTPGVDTWVIVGVSGTCYASKAALISAGDAAWPDLDPGLNTAPMDLYVRNQSSSGSDFMIAFNETTTPSNGQNVTGTGQEVVYPVSFWNVWLKTNGSDSIGLQLFLG